MPDWLDLLLVAVITAFAVPGYRQGLAAGVLSLTGFACGAAAGARVAPGLSRALVPAGASRVFLAIAIGFAAAVTGMLLASVLAHLLRRLSRRPAGLVDSVGGAALNIVFLLVVAVMVASSAASGLPGFLSRQVDGSLVLRTLDQVVPKDTRYLFNSVRVSMVRRLVDASGLNPTDLPPPSRGVLNATATALAGRGVVKVEAEAGWCSPLSRRSVDGSGLVIGPDHVLTNAHVIVGLIQPPVVTLAGGRRYQAHVVLYDPQRDLAVLYVRGLRATPMRFTGSASYGTRAIVAGFPRGGRLTLVPATIGTSFRAVMAGTSASEGFDMEVYPVRAQVKPGNSGGPLMAPDGGVYGIIFATSSNGPHSGWAMTTSDVARDAAVGRTLTRSVPTESLLSC